MHQDDPLTEVGRWAAAVEDHQLALDAARVQRDLAIRAAFAAGCPIHALARAGGLTGSRVSELLGSPHRKPGRPRTAELRQR